MLRIIKNDSALLIIILNGTDVERPSQGCQLRTVSLCFRAGNHLRVGAKLKIFVPVITMNVKVRIHPFLNLA